LISASQHRTAELVFKSQQKRRRLLKEFSHPMKTKVVRLILGAAIALASPLATLHAQFAYVANLNSNNVSAYSIGSGGVLTPVPGSPFPVGPNPASVAVDPTGKFAYRKRDPADRTILRDDSGGLLQTGTQRKVRVQEGYWRRKPGGANYLDR
jgi:hypothetical protein